MNKKLNIVKELIELGLGRRKIAESLDISEWAARQLMKDIDLESIENKLPDTYIGIPNHKIDSSVGKPTISKKHGYNSPIPANPEYSNDFNLHTIKLNTTYQVAVLSDWHVPYQNKIAVKLAKDYLLDNVPDEIIILGDFADMYSVSSYEKDGRKETLQNEIDECKFVLEDWVRTFPSTKFRFNEGNHEKRQSKFLRSKAAALLSLSSLRIEELLQLKKLGVDWIPYEEDLSIGNMTFVHGSYARKNAGNSIRAHYDLVGGSVIMGHVHRMSIAHKRTKTGDHLLIENGCLSSLSVDYTRQTDWVNGFTVINFIGNEPTAFQLSMANDRLISPDGTVYSLE